MTDQFVPNYVLRFLHHKLPILSSTQNWSGSYMDPAFYELGICGPLKSQNGVLTIVWMCREVLLTVLFVSLVITLGESPEVTKYSSIGGPEQLDRWHSPTYILTQILCISWRTYQPIHVRTHILCINWRADQLPRGIKNSSQVVCGVITWATCQYCYIHFWMSVHLIRSILDPNLFLKFDTHSHARCVCKKWMVCLILIHHNLEIDNTNQKYGA